MGVQRNQLEKKSKLILKNCTSKGASIPDTMKRQPHQKCYATLYTLSCGAQMFTSCPRSQPQQGYRQYIEANLDPHTSIQVCTFHDNREVWACYNDVERVIEGHLLHHLGKLSDFQLM